MCDMASYLRAKSFTAEALDRLSLVASRQVGRGEIVQENCTMQVMSRSTRRSQNLLLESTQLIVLDIDTR